MRSSARVAPAAMDEVEYYRSQAAECRTSAEPEPALQQRRQLLALAKHYDAEANEARRGRARH